MDIFWQFSKVCEVIRRDVIYAVSERFSLSYKHASLENRRLSLCEFRAQALQRKIATGLG